MPRPSRLAAALPLLLLGACKSDFGNPFDAATRSFTPRPGNDLIVASNTPPATPGGHEIFAVGDDGTGLTQLTFCNAERPPCDTLEASAAPGRERVIVRRRADLNGDGRLDANDGQALIFVDLARGTQAELVPGSAMVSGLDWSPAGDVLVYAGLGEGGVEDLFRADPNGQNNRNLTATPIIRERRPRIDPTGTIAVYERIEADGKGAIFIFVDRFRQVRVTSGGPGTALLAGTPYVVGADADPDFSPDGRSIAFRRLTGTGAGGLGTWDIMTVRSDGTGLATAVTGEAWRGPPDWGPGGIVFEERDAQTGARRLVVAQPDGTGQRAVLTVAAGAALGFPRWLP